MKKNYQIHLVIETEVVEKLKKEATAEQITFSELLRRKVKNPDENSMKFMIEALYNKLVVKS